MLSWETMSVPPHEQFSFWREGICRTFVELRPEAANTRAGFPSRVVSAPLNTVTRAWIDSVPQTTIHGPKEVSASEGPYFFVNAQITGTCRVQQRGNDAIAGPGQLVVLDTSEPFRLEHRSDWSMLSFRVPHPELDARLPQERRGVGLPFDRTGVGAVAVDAMRSLWELGSATPARSIGELESAFLAVVSAALLSVGQTAHAADPVTRRAQILAHVSRRLADPTLSAQSIAHALHMSVRTLHTAFEGGEETFAVALRRLRMEQAARILTGSETSVGDASRAVGYEDPASFSRAFRRMYGASPIEFRREVTKF